MGPSAGETRAIQSWLIFANLLLDKRVPRDG